MNRVIDAMKLSKVTIPFVILTLCSSVSYAADYNLSDLETLDSTGEWSELLEHAKDISPSKRDENWRAMVLRASVAMLAQQSKEDAIGAFDTIVTLDSAHNWLSDSQEWQSQRADSGLAAVRTCISDSYYIDGCLDAIGVLVAGDPGNAELGFEVASLVRARASAQQALPLLDDAFENANEHQTEIHCESEDTLLTAMQGLESLDENLAARAINIVFNACEESLVAPAFEKFLEGERSVAVNTCPLWREHNRLSGFQQAHCEDMEIAQ